MPPVSEVEVLEVDDSASLLAAPRLRRVGGGTSGAPRGDLESFNGKFREYCLDLHWFATIGDARETIETWRIHYNTVRPHSSLGLVNDRSNRRAPASPPA